MKAMIFAAGMGTRLRPLTDHTPKALVTVGGIPMLQQVITRLRAAGFTDITINIHHLGQQIIDFLEANHSFGVTTHISDEREALLDTGGGIWHARRFLDGDEPFLVHNVDIWTQIDLQALYRRHIDSGADATLLVSDRPTQRKLLFDNRRQLCGWMNQNNGETKPQGFAYNPAVHRAWAFGGIHVLSPSVFRHMEAQPAWRGAFPIIPFYLDYCRQASVRAYTADCAEWFDIGKPDTLQAANEHCLRRHTA